MLSVTQQVIEEKTTLNCDPKKKVKIKILSHSSAEKLQDAVRIKYKKAFDLLKDK